jgi:hypothetical protein
LRLLPVGHAGLVQGHEIDLATGTAFGARKEYFVVTFAQKLQTLSLLVHEHAVQMARLDRTDLDRLIAPTHYLACSDVRHRRGHLAPLEKKT